VRELTPCLPCRYIYLVPRCLQQIVINLANNSFKFVTKGFIRVGAKIVDDKVQVFVEDSGPGIPAEKRAKLFEKFQTSLDSLSQGTGIGLSLCKDLALLMGGDISLDDDYDSGVQGCSGTRFVIELNTPPLDLHDHPSTDGSPESTLSSDVTLPELPAEFKILFVDDDLVLRKLFCRSVKRVAPDWEVHEASNGETALRMLDSANFDLIFIDQYMASIQKQMLGTEAVRALRSKGFVGIICGLSANNMDDAFLAAGADAFMLKPFPCEEYALKKELDRVIHGDSDV